MQSPGQRLKHLTNLLRNISLYYMYLRVFISAIIKDKIIKDTSLYYFKKEFISKLRRLLNLEVTNNVMYNILYLAIYLQITGCSRF